MTKDRWLGGTIRALRRPFSAASAVASGSFLLYMGALPSLYLPDIRVADSYVPAIVATAALSWVLGLAFGRFLLRALPLRGDGQIRRGVIVFAVLASLTWFAAWLAMASVGSAEWASLGGEQLWAASPELQVRFAGYLAVVAWWLGAFLPFLARHLAPRRALEHPFVLFLRRFSTFSDRSAVSAVLKCTPAGKPVAFLTPTASSIQDWNPFRIGFAGLKLWRPLRSMPIDLRAGDRGWQPVAESLIAGADAVVLDASQGSEAIEAEIEMIRNGGFEEKTVVIAQEARGARGDDLLAPVGGSSDVVLYRKSWLRAMPRLLLGLFATFFAAMPLAVILIPVLAPGVTQLEPTQEIDAFGQQIGQKRVVLPLAALGLWIYFVLFVRAALDRDSIRRLARRLRAS